MNETTSVFKQETRYFVYNNNNNNNCLFIIIVQGCFTMIIPNTNTKKLIQYYFL